MTNKTEIIDKINRVLYERLFPAFKKISFQKHREKRENTLEHKNLSKDEKRKKLNKLYQNFYQNRQKFYLSLFSIYAIYPLCKQEKKIQLFISQSVSKVRVDYMVDSIEFSADYNTGYTSNMEKEIEDCIYDLQNRKNKHIVDTYTPIKDFSKAPPKPLTNARLKYSCYYLFGFEASYVTYLSLQLFRAGLITNPETNGWFIDDDKAETMISLLNEKYNEKEVLQYKRSYPEDKIDRSAEAVAPVILAKDYFPKKIEKTEEFKKIDWKNSREEEDAKKLYSFIYYITLSTQMKDSLYDRSKLTIQAGNRKLHQQANMLIKGYENWEKLAGRYIAKIRKNDLTEEQTVVLPSLKQGDVLQPLHVYRYTFNSRRPPRFGKGRFIEQILEKQNIASNAEQDKILDELINSGAVHLIDNEMLCPQEPSIELIDWLEEHIPQFVDIEYLKEIKDKIEQVLSGELSLESVLDEINALIDDGFSKANFTETDGKPSGKKIKLVKAIAAKNGIRITDDLLSSDAKCDYFLSQHPPEDFIDIGRCPKCNGTIYRREYISEENEILYYFSCENFSKNGCNFSVWDNYIYKFFSSRSYELHTLEERIDTLKKILSKKKGYFFEGFISKAKKSYSGFVFFEEYINEKNNQSWRLQIKFPRKKK